MPGANPGWTTGYVPPASEWNQWWSNKVDTAGDVTTTMMKAGGGTTAVTLAARGMADLSLMDFGVVGNGIADDSAACQAAMNYSSLTGNAIRATGLLGNSFMIHTALNVGSGLNLEGSGPGSAALGGPNASIFIAAANIAGVFTVPAGTSNYQLRNLSVSAGATTSRCVYIVRDDTGNHFSKFYNCQFVGSPGINLVSNEANWVEFNGCGFVTSGATVCLSLGINNLNTMVMDCWFLGGSGIEIANAGSGQLPQGIRIQNNLLVNFGGAYNILVGGGSGSCFITNNLMDQALGPSVICNGNCTNIMLANNYFGQQVAGHAAMSIDPTCSHITIDNNQFGNAGINIVVGATTTQRAADIRIVNNTFLPTGGTGTPVCLSLDSVEGCFIDGNSDQGFAPSFQVFATNSLGGAYTFGGSNSWSSAPITVLDRTVSSYLCHEDRGASLKKSGLVSTTGTSIVVNHGVCTTPNVIQATPQGANPGSWYINTVGPTTFTITWTTSGPVGWSWSAEFRS